MKFFKKCELKKETGAATIEAIVSFTAFLFVIFTILNVVNVCRAQMLISNAVDTATKELTQYSYFYKMSGLQKFKGDLGQIGEQGKTNLNDVLGTVGDLYSSIGTAADNTVQNATNVQNTVEEGTLNLEQIQNTIAGVQSDATKIESSINNVMDSFDAVQDNPLMYMKSIIAVAGNEGLDTLVSHVIAAPLARSFTIKHFGSTVEEADAYLENLGVVDGLDGINFKMSTLFSTAEPENVHIVVYYRVRIVQLLDWMELEVPMCKESVARAWLAGDDVQAKVTPMVPVTEKNEEEIKEETSSENTENAETTELWALPARSEDGYTLVKDPAFRKLMGEQYGFDAHADGAYICGKNGETAYGCTMVTDNSQLLKSDGSSQIAENAYLNAMKSLSYYEKQYDPDDPNWISQYKPGDVKKFEYVVYLPENIPDDKYNEIVSTSKNNAAQYESKGKEVIGRDVEVNIKFVKAGGTYNYGSEE